MDKAVFKWFSLQRSQKVPIDGPIFQENFPTFKDSDGWLDKWKKGKKTTFTVK